MSHRILSSESLNAGKEVLLLGSCSLHPVMTEGHFTPKRSHTLLTKIGLIIFDETKRNERNERNKRNKRNGSITNG